MLIPFSNWWLTSVQTLPWATPHCTPDGERFKLFNHLKLHNLLRSEDFPECIENGKSTGFSEKK